MFPRGWNQSGSCGSRVLTNPSFASSRSCFYPHLGTHLAERGLNFFWTQPCVRPPSPGPFYRTQRMARFTLPASSSGPPGWEPRGSLRWGRRGGLSVGAGSPVPLSFYELQREAKFPQPPNETKSKSKLIGNRREGEDWLGKSWGLDREGSCVCEDACSRVMG